MKTLAFFLTVLLAGLFVACTPAELEGKGITHVNILRTLEAMYGLCKAGAQQQNVLANGITDDYIVTDVFETAQ